MTDAYQRIIDNPFYEYMQRDSNIIVANLSSIGRALYWVEDKASPTSSHFGESAFIIGSTYDDKLKGGKSSDYLYGGNGNDTFKAGEGSDRVDGGSGQDELVLSGTRSNWNVYRLADGTVFFDNKTNSDLILTENIEKVSFEGDLLSPLAYQINSDSLSKWGLFGTQKITYKSVTQGNDNNNTLSGATVFGMDGDDVLTAASIGGLLHGGLGNDKLTGKSGSDQLYGAEGNDVFYGSSGSDVLFGGVGNDSFIFSQRSTGKTIIKDFNHFDGDNDKLSFAKTIFGSQSALATSTQQVGEDVIIRSGSYSIVLENTSMDMVLNHTAII
jgi:triacylglycerol lipase